MMLGPVIWQILCFWSPVELILVLCFVATQPMESMSMAFNTLGRILLVRSAWAVEFSVWMGVHGCGCPISLNVHHIETTVLAWINNAPTLASAADDIIALIFCKILSTAPLLMGMSSVPAMNMWPPALLWSLG
jgi:hypothetical protein